MVLWEGRRGLEGVQVGQGRVIHGGPAQTNRPLVAVSGRNHPLAANNGPPKLCGLLVPRYDVIRPGFTKLSLSTTLTGWMWTTTLPTRSRTLRSLCFTLVAFVPVKGRAFTPVAHPPERKRITARPPRRPLLHGPSHPDGSDPFANDNLRPSLSTRVPAGRGPAQPSAGGFFPPCVRSTKPGLLR